MPPRAEWSSYESALAGKTIFKAPIKNPVIAGSPLYTGNPFFAQTARMGMPGEQTVSGNPPEVIVLIGVLAGEPPQAVLENTVLHETYYLAAGQSKDGMTVEEIHDDGVVVRIGEERKKLPR